MILKTTEELCDFTREKLEKSGLSIRELSEKIGKKERWVAKATQENMRSSTSANGIRRQVLEFLGYEVTINYSVIRQKKA